MNDNVRKIFDMLGVEPKECFRVRNGKFFLESNLIATDENGNYHEDLIRQILTGEVEIKKIPFVPKKGDEYYFVNTLSKNIFSSNFSNSYLDYMYFYAGNCFRTREEAEKALESGFADKIKEKYEQALAEQE